MEIPAHRRHWISQPMGIVSPLPWREEKNLIRESNFFFFFQCQLSAVKCHMSCVTCHMSSVTCHYKNSHRHQTCNEPFFVNSEDLGSRKSAKITTKLKSCKAAWIKYLTQMYSFNRYYMILLCYVQSIYIYCIIYMLCYL